jgi:cytidylate kinase
MKQIAIDGPAGAGKSTIAKAVSKELQFVYIDTGAMYRAIGLYVLRNNVSKDDEENVVKLAKSCDVTISYENGEQVVSLNGENVNGFIRTPEVGEYASAISVFKEVREKLVYLQQELAKTTNVVMDGRDIGSKVLPDATLKVYLDADVNVRAKRRYDELTLKGEKVDLKELTEEMKARDYRDMHRDNSPLVRVPDAKYVDSSYMTPEEVKDRIIELYREADK